MTDQPEEPRGKGRSRSPGNSTIATGARLLIVVAGLNGPATLTRIAAASGMLPSRAYRYLRGLCDAGLLSQERSSGRYDLGPETLNLGLAAISRIDPVRQALAILPMLTEETGLASLISVWGSHGPTVIRCEHANLTAPIRIREGLILPLLQTAAGNLFLAHESEAATAELLAREVHDWNLVHKGKGRMTAARIEEIRSDVRKRGAARTIGLRTSVHANLAAPVFGHDGKLELVITLIGVRGTFNTAFTGPPAKKLLAAAKDLSRKIGADGNGAVATS
jgi:DNA-binding IclR family transcriptional regulator